MSQKPDLERRLADYYARYTPARKIKPADAEPEDPEPRKRVERFEYSVPVKINNFDPRWREIWSRFDVAWTEKAFQMGVPIDMKPKTMWIDVTPDGQPFPHDEYEGPDPVPWSACRAHPIWPHESMKRRGKKAKSESKPWEAK